MYGALLLILFRLTKIFFGLIFVSFRVIVVHHPFTEFFPFFLRPFVTCIFIPGVFIHFVRSRITFHDHSLMYFLIPCVQFNKQEPNTTSLGNFSKEGKGPLYADYKGHFTLILQVYETSSMAQNSFYLLYFPLITIHETGCN